MNRPDKKHAMTATLTNRELNSLATLWPTLESRNTNDTPELSETRIATISPSGRN